MPRLKKPTQRDEALNELRVGLYFKSLNYRIVEWEPPGNNNKKGEYSITPNGEDVVFVEVKSPGWEGQLDPEEQRSVRKKQPKYMPGEIRCARGQWPQVRACIERAYPKFLPDCKNLLVIADDLRVPLDDLPMEIALYNPHLLSTSLAEFGCSEYGFGCFASNKFENIGGVARFENRLLSSRSYFSDCYRLYLYPNTFGLKQLPPFRRPAPTPHKTH